MRLTTLTPILLLPLLTFALPQVDQGTTTHTWTSTSTLIIIQTQFATQTATPTAYLPLIVDPDPHNPSSGYPDISLRLESSASVQTKILVAPPSSARLSTPIPFPITTATTSSSVRPSGTGSLIVTASTPLATFTGAATRPRSGSRGLILAVAGALVAACI